ncbi:hypothetical protein TELCIR_14209 [Teladorsagia circumcincta]|uniref:Uncharacterized protein n=1 Tax=Teladorsagia circumcincta TaxID=45464 RepID=A0A2G9U1L8_TELCI|nr:hypothetical protein TELCIR_14209 [Teladorsagia circumcincta]
MPKEHSKENGLDKCYHDGTLLALMYAMGVGNNLMIPYASAVIMEIFKEGNEYQVELLFRNDTTRGAYPMTIPNCGSPCTVGNMAKQYQSMLLSSYADQQKAAPNGQVYQSELHSN